MNRKQIYQESVDILLDSYNKETLETKNCCACAVGNLIAARQGWGYIDNPKGYTSIKWDCEKLPYWYSIVAYNIICQEEKLEAEKQIECTGYTIGELKMIEKAFESVIEFSKGLSRDRNIILRGLTAVLDVLQEIHEIDSDVAEENQEKLQCIYNSKLALV